MHLKSFAFSKSLNPPDYLTLLVPFWEVLNGVGVDGVGVIFPFFTHFPLFLRIFPFFTHFSPFSSLFSASPKGQRGISLRPRLHRPRAKLPDFWGASGQVSQNTDIRACQKLLLCPNDGSLFGVLSEPEITDLNGN